MREKNTYIVTVGKGDITDSMNITAHSTEEAGKLALELFYFDGYHLISSEVLCKA